MKAHCRIFSAVIFLSIFLLGFVFAAVPAASSSSCQAAIPDIQKRGVLTVGMVNPALNQSNPEAMRKKDKALMNGLAEALHVKLKVDNSYDSFNAVIDAVETRKVDLAISFLSVTPPRLSQINFSMPYATVGQDVVLDQNVWNIIKHKKNVTSMLDNYKTRIAVFKDTAYEWFARGLFPSAQIVYFNNWDEIVAALKNRVVGVAIVNELEYQEFFTKNKQVLDHLAKVPLNDFLNDNIAVAIPKPSCDLLKFTNAYLIKHHLTTDKYTLDEKKSDFKA